MMARHGQAHLMDSVMAVLLHPQDVVNVEANSHRRAQKFGRL